jgi:hypothetical protein
MFRKRDRQPKRSDLTGPDFVLLAAEHQRDAGHVDSGLAEAFSDMVRDAIGASISATPERREAAEAPLLPGPEQVAFLIACNAISMASGRRASHPALLTADLRVRRTIFSTHRADDVRSVEVVGSSPHHLYGPCDGLLGSHTQNECDRLFWFPMGSGDQNPIDSRRVEFLSSARRSPLPGCRTRNRRPAQNQ